MTYQVGDRVRAKEAIYEPADDHAPGGYVCGKGDLLIVRKVRERGRWPLSVSHEDVNDNSFACGLDEVTPDGVTGTPKDDGYCPDCEDVRHCGTIRKCLHGKPGTPGVRAGPPTGIAGVTREQIAELRHGLGQIVAEVHEDRTKVKCCMVIDGILASLAADCTEPNRAACPRRCIDFCNKAEEDRAAAPGVEEVDRG